MLNMVKEIPLKGGDVALVDDDDYPLLSRHMWQRAGRVGYAVTTMQFADEKNRTIYMHKLIIGGFMLCDHINQNPLDNRKENLRPSTVQQNGWNKGKPKGCRHGKPTSRYKGVRKEFRTDGTPYWRVNIKITKKGVKPEKCLRIGPFHSEIEAAKAYNREIVKLRGEFAWVNPIPDEPVTRLMKETSRED